MSLPLKLSIVFENFFMREYSYMYIYKEYHILKVFIFILGCHLSIDTLQM